MAAPRQYTDEQYAAMAELVNTRGMSIAGAIRTLAAGYGDLAPFEVGRDTVSAAAGRDRSNGTRDIEGLELADALDKLGRECLATIGHRLAQIREQPSKFDATEVLTITRALSEAKGLVKPKGKNGQEKAPTFLEAAGQNGTHTAQAGQASKQALSSAPAATSRATS